MTQDADIDQQLRKLFRQLKPNGRFRLLCALIQPADYEAVFEQLLGQVEVQRKVLARDIGAHFLKRQVVKRDGDDAPSDA